MTDARIQKMIDLALQEVNYHEGRDPNGNWNNQTKYANDPLVADLHGQGASWCALFAPCWLAAKAGIANEYPRTLWVPGLVSQSKKDGTWSEYPGVGALAVFGHSAGATDAQQFSHVGLSIGYSADNFRHVDGNTNSNNSAQGDGVYDITTPRRIDWIRGYIYPRTIRIDNADPSRQPMESYAHYLDTAFGFAADKMSMSQIQDYAKRAKAAGYTGAILYVSKHPSKNINKAILQVFLDLGFAIALVFENATDDFMGGAAAGAANGDLALTMANNVGYQKGCTIFCAYDRNNVVMTGAALEYGKAFAAKIRQGGYVPGGYGNQSVTSSGVFDVGWEVQTWGRRDGEHVLQIVGSTLMPGTDDNKVLKAFPAMRKGAVVAPVKPQPAPPTALPVVSLGHLLGAAAKDAPSPNNGKTWPTDTLILEKALRAEGLLPQQYVDGSFGTVTIQAYSKWQQSLGYTGKDSNGYPGLTSLQKLGSKHGFRAVA